MIRCEDMHDFDEAVKLRGASENEQDCSTPHRRFLEKFLGVIRIYPFRCIECEGRLWRILTLRRRPIRHNSEAAY
jgi:hypothetical protein